MPLNIDRTKSLRVYYQSINAVNCQSTTFHTSKLLDSSGVTINRKGLIVVCVHHLEMNKYYVLEWLVKKKRLRCSPWHENFIVNLIPHLVKWDQQWLYSGKNKNVKNHFTSFIFIMRSVRCDTATEIWAIWKVTDPGWRSNTWPHKLQERVKDSDICRYEKCPKSILRSAVEIQRNQNVVNFHIRFGCPWTSAYGGFLLGCPFSAVPCVNPSEELCAVCILQT